MPQYVVVPFEVSPDAIAQDAYEYLSDQIPGWQPNTGNLDTIILEAASLEAATVRELARNVTTAIFRYFGASLMGIVPIEESVATVDSTWTAIDTLGHVIEEGTQVGIRNTVGEIIPFKVLHSISILAGGDSTEDGEVSLVALTPGSEATGLGGDGTSADLLDIIDWVDTITLSGTTSGGISAEEDTAYLNRLVAQLQLLSTRPILARDAEVWARSIPSVARALAIDNYNPQDDTFDNERMVAVAVVQSDGEPVSTPTKTAVDALLQAQREINFVFWVIDPTYTSIDISYTVKVLDGFNGTQIVSDVADALIQYLDPSIWGRLTAETTEWQRVTTLRYLEVATVINNVPGVDYIVSLQMAQTGDTLGTTDVNLDGVAPLTRPGSILGNFA